MTRLVRRALLRLLALALAFPLVSGRSVSQVREVVPVVPSADPFYQPPPGFETAAPGTILRERRIASSFFGLIPNPVLAYQLLYRTTAINGSAIATVTTVFKPLIAKPDRFVSFHTAYDSSATICNPSYNYQLGAPQTNLISSFEMLLLQAYLLSGYIVASPDYEGPEAAFGAGRLAGTGVLDGMRAVVNFRTRLAISTPNPMIVGVGYSGGALATGWAASLQPGYAPELVLKGWVQGGTPANLTDIVVAIDGTLFNGFVPAAVGGLNKPSAYGSELQPLFDRILTPYGRELLDNATSQCAVDNLIDYAEQSILTTKVQSLGRDLLYDPTVTSVLSRIVMGIRKDETPTAPVFLYHAVDDEIVPYVSASTLADRWCTNGASVQFTTLASGGHITTEIVSLPDALKFTTAAFAGKTTKGCSKSTKLDGALDPLALGVGLEPILIKLIEALAAIGKDDTNVRNNVQTLGKVIV